MYERVLLTDVRALHLQLRYLEVCSEHRARELLVVSPF